MIVAVGTDSIAIERIAALWRTHGPRFLARVFTAAEAERQALAGLEGSCLIALGAWGRVLSRDILALDVEVFDLDGRERLRVGLEGNREAPDVLGGEVAQRLRELGAERLLRAGRSP